MKKTCSHKGCEKPATHGIELRLWAKGYAKHENNCMRMYMPVPLCLGCALEVKPADFLIDESWLRIESALMAIDKAAPDRTSAEIHPAPLQDVSQMMTAANADPKTVVLDSREKMN